MIRDLLILTAAAAIGNMVAEKWVLRQSDDDKTGFVTIKEGFGMDDIARAATIALVAMLAHKIVPG